MAARKQLKMSHELANKIRQMVYEKAQACGLPPVYLTAHVRSTAADKARHELWAEMIHELGLKRQFVADIFGRDRRRLRASVLARSIGETRVIPRKAKKTITHRKMPVQPVGNQFVWCFAVPLRFDQPITQQIERQPVTQSIMTFAKPLPDRLRCQLSHEERLALARFHEKQAKLLRYSEVGA